MTKREEHEKLEQDIQNLYSLMNPEILRNKNWGNTIDFSIIEPDFLNLKNSIKIIIHLNTSYIPIDTSKQISQYIELLSNILISIESFAIKDDFTLKSNELIKSFRSAHKQLTHTFAIWLPFLATIESFEGSIFNNIDMKHKDIQQQIDNIGVNIENNIEKIESFSEDFLKYKQTVETEIQDFIHKKNGALSDTTLQCERMRDDIIKFVEEKSQKAEETLSTVRANSGIQAIRPYSKRFNDLASEFNKSSNNWLISSIGFLIVSLAWGIYCLKSSPPISDQPSILVYYATSRILITVIVLSGLFWCARQYKIARHQRTVNSNKAAALDSFEAFIEATNDTKTRDVVLMQTAQSIFNTGPTGYLTKDSDHHQVNYIDYMKLISSK